MIIMNYTGLYVNLNLCIMIQLQIQISKQYDQT